MSSNDIARACTGSAVKLATGRWEGPIGATRLYRFGPFIPL
jgi:hypothetical protein